MTDLVFDDFSLDPRKRRLTAAPRTKGRRSVNRKELTPEELEAQIVRHDAKVTQAILKNRTLPKSEQVAIANRDSRRTLARLARAQDPAARDAQAILGGVPKIPDAMLSTVTRNLRQKKRELPTLYPRAFKIGLVQRKINPEAKGKLRSCYISETKTDGSAAKTLDDPRMGPDRLGAPCGDCTDKNCPGNYGYIEFARRIINPKFLRIIISILQVVCHSCSNLLETNVSNLEKLRKIPAKNRLAALVAMNPGTTARCNVGEENGIRCDPPREYKITPSLSEGKIIYATAGNSGKKETDELSIDDIEQVFNNMTEETADLIGFKKEDLFSFIMEGMYVPPRICRPNKAFKGLVKPAVHVITDFLVNIIGANKALKESVEADGDVGSKSDIGQNTKELHMRVLTYMDHIDAIMQGKKEMVREMVVGKRTDFSARVVIVPASDETDFGWIEIPRKLINELSRLETVTPDNIVALQQLVRDGQVIKIAHHSGKYEGYVQTVTPKNILTEFCTLNVGDVINRKLRDGDWIIAYRSPAIHRHSVMAFRVRLVDGNAAGVHLFVTPGFNADFDGDEMTFIVPQSEGALWEAEHTLNIQRNIMSSQTGTPIVGGVQNTVSGSYRLTTPGTRVEKDLLIHYHTLLTSRSQLKTLKERLKTAGKEPIDELSGRALFSSILPEDFEYPSFRGVEIHRGVLINGVITSAEIGPGANGSIIHKMHLDPRYGWERTSVFLTDLSRVLAAWSNDHPMSVGVSSIAAAFDPAAREKIRKRNETLEEFRAEMSANITTTQLINTTDKLSNLGTDILREDDVRRAKAGGQKNPFTIMSKKVGSGAKGSEGNSSQIFGQIGLAVNSTGPMAKALTGGTRMLTTFRPGDESLAACGLITSGYATGMRPNEFTAKAMADREAAIDPITKLPVVGDAHRKAAMALGKIGVYNNMISDASSKNIYETLYGGDGLDATETIRINGQLTFIDIGTEIRRINLRRGWRPVIATEAMDIGESDLDLMIPYYGSETMILSDGEDIVLAGEEEESDVEDEPVVARAEEVIDF